ncbi:MAG: hypothetical protein H0X33_04115 [Taibaiella sp.]|nr:hypothetical protein [Taibaiella sp.]
MIPIIFNRRLFVLLFIGFIIAAIAGTLSHECGHWIAFRATGYKNAYITYAYTYPGRPGNENFQQLAALFDAYKFQINNDLPFAERDRYFRLAAIYRKQDLIMRIAGPLETLAAGSIGLMILWIRRKKFSLYKDLKWWQWLCIFLSLFWLRQLFNLCCALFTLVSKGHIKGNGDEFRIAINMGLPHWSVIVITGIISAFILAIIVFRFIPFRQRLTFLLAGLAGGLMGAYLWLVLLGPVLMPNATL